MYDKFLDVVLILDIFIINILKIRRRINIKSSFKGGIGGCIVNIFVKDCFVFFKIFLLRCLL